MSVRMMSLVFQRYGYERFDGEVPEDETGDASTAEVLLAQAMADHADDDGANIYPSLRKLSRKSRQSVSSVRRYIKLMVAIGWLLRVNSGAGGRGNTNEYRINPEWIKGINLTPFAARRKHFAEKGLDAPLDPSLEPSRTQENPVTAVAPFPEEKGSSLNTFEAERVPNQGRKGATAVVPESSEPKNQDAHAPARRSARTRDPEPEPERVRPTAEQILGAWRNRLAPIMASEIVLQLWNRRIAVDRNFPSWPDALRQPFLVALQAVADDAANLEISRGACSPAMRLQADTAAQNAATAVVERYAQHHQVAA